MKKFVTLLLVVTLLTGITNASAWSCPGCDNEMNSKFCSECGTQKPENTCSYCGANFGELSPNFCSDCGSKMVKADEAAAIIEVTATAKGMFSDVNVTITKNRDGTIATIVVDVSGETKGIATPCAEDAFLSQFIGKAGPFDKVDVVTGATSTSNAILEAVNSLFTVDETTLSQNAEAYFDPALYTYEQLREIASTINDYLPQDDMTIDCTQYSDEELKSLRNLINAELKKREDSQLSPSSASEFKYVSNGKEIQINEYIGNGGNVVIPSEIDGLPVTRIGNDAFKGKNNVTGVVLPETLEYIGEYAFYDLDNLTGVLVIPKSVKTIGGHAFQVSGVTGVVILGDCYVDLNALCNLFELEFVYVADGCSPHFSNASINCYNFNDRIVNVILPDTNIVFDKRNFTDSKYVRFYTPAGSKAAEFANDNFIECNTSDYADIAAKYAAIYLGNAQNKDDVIVESKDAVAIAREKVIALIGSGAKELGDGKFIEDSYKSHPNDEVIANMYFYHTAKESYERYELFGSDMYLTTAIDYASMIDPNYRGIFYEDVQTLANKVLGNEQREEVYQTASQKEDTYNSLTNAQKKEICKYIQSRFDYYGKLDGTSGGKYTDTVWKETCEKYGLTESQVDIIWMNMYSY